VGWRDATPRLKGLRSAWVCRKNFLWQKFRLETAVSSGVVSGKIDVLKLGAQLDPMVQAANVMKVASIQVATQLTEMGIGARDKFDIAAIGEQVIAALAAVQIADKLSTVKMLDPKTPAGKIAIRAANTAVSTAIAAATHTPINIQQAAMQAVSGMAADEASSYFHNQAEKTSFVNDVEPPELIRIDKPELVLPKPAYGEISYGMGVLNQARMENERLVNVSPVNQQAVVIPPVVVTAKSSISQQFTSGSTISSASSTASQIFEAYESLPWIAQVGVGVVGIGVGVALLPPALSGLAVGTLDAVGAAFLMGAPAEAPVIAGATGAALASVGLTRAAVSSVDKFGFFGRARGEKIGISASSPSEIAWGYGSLSRRQAGILESLQKPGQFLQLYKSDISPTDLSALTAHTGDEFALFTMGSRRMVVRGTASGLRIDANLSNKLLTQEWRWSAHTHPGLSDNVLAASGFPGDRQALQLFNQERSLILNSAGRRSIFDSENDFAITKQENYATLRQGY